MHLIFVRHGETELNKLKKKMGQRIDDGLDETGLEQAKEVLTKLPSNFSVIYSSPLKRAMHTAEIIAVHFDKQIIHKDELKERDFGTLSGKTFDEMKAETGLEIEQLDDQLKYDYQPYGGESVEQVKARLQKFLTEIKTERKNDETVVVVTHFGLISLMNSLYPPIEHHKLSNATVHKFEI